MICRADVVYVPEEVLGTQGAQAAARVHGIPASEIAHSAAFPVLGVASSASLRLCHLESCKVTFWETY